jgi:hypothetical protein
VRGSREFCGDGWTGQIGHDTHSKNGRDTHSWEVRLRLLRPREVLQLTGLTADQLREWTVRRELIQPDVPAQQRGSEAKFSWQTVLLLRLAVVLRTRFHVELQAHRNLLVTARELLDGASFPGLWGVTLAIYDLRRCELLSPREPLAAYEDAILLRLNRHLEVLSQGFGLPDPVGQLPLFPAIPIKSSDVAVGGARLAKMSRS